MQVAGYLTNHLIAHLPSYRVRHAWYRHVVGIRLGEGAMIHMNCYLTLPGLGRLRREHLLSIGERTRVNRGCQLDARGGLRIGNDVSLSPEVAIVSAEHRRNDPSFEYTTKPVVVEDHAWVAVRAIILPGVTVGRGAVVGAGAVVTRDVPPRTVVAGVPASPIGTRDLNPAYRLAGSRALFE